MGKKIKGPGAKRPFYVRDKEIRREDADRRSGEEIREDKERQIAGRRANDDRRDDDERRK